MIVQNIELKQVVIQHIIKNHIAVIVKLLLQEVKVQQHVVHVIIQFL